MAFCTEISSRVSTKGDTCIIVGRGGWGRVPSSCPATLCAVPDGVWPRIITLSREKSQKSLHGRTSSFNRTFSFNICSATQLFPLLLCRLSLSLSLAFFTSRKYLVDAQLRVEDIGLRSRSRATPWTRSTGLRGGNAQGQRRRRWRGYDRGDERKRGLGGGGGRRERGRSSVRENLLSIFLAPMVHVVMWVGRLVVVLEVDCELVYLRWKA